MLIDFSKIITRDNPNLIVILIDSSSSMTKWKDEIEKELQEIKEFFIKLSDENSILILRADFSGSYKEKEISIPSEMDTNFSTGGKSIFYYSICRIRESLICPNEGYVNKMINKSYNPKVTMFVISDGKDDGSKASGYYINEACEAIHALNQNEIETHILLFGKEYMNSAKQLGFQHIHTFDRDSKGITTMFDNIKECSKSRITEKNNYYFDTI